MVVEDVTDGVLPLFLDDDDEENELLEGGFLFNS